MRSGLGNRLLPWARCAIFSEVNGAIMLAPYWTNLKIGPMLRSESDSRLYMGLFQRAPEEMSHLRAFCLRPFLEVQSEPEEISTPVIHSNSNSLFLFSGRGSFFKPLLGWESFLHNRLRSIVRPKWLSYLNSRPRVPIAIHVRRGDFSPTNNSKEPNFVGLVYTPLSWFIDSLKQIRQAMGYCAKAIVVSNGDPTELRELLEQENVEWVESPNAICGILTLSKADVLMASGTSTFSCWASFLGDMPSISHPDQNMSSYGLRDRPDRFMGVFDPSKPDERFLSQVAAISSLRN